MSFIFSGEQGSQYYAEDYKYKYPMDRDYKPNSDLTKKLISEIKARLTESQNIMSSRYPHWQAIDKNLNVYVSADANEDEYNARDVVIPASSAMLETILAYVTATFANDPIFRFNPTGPEDAIGVQMLEAAIAHQTHKFKHLLALNTMWRDSFVYGIGPVTVQWKIKQGFKTQVVEDGIMDVVKNVFNVKTRSKKRSTFGTLYEGNDIVNIDPYSYFPDPNVSSNNIEEAEFVGWVSSISYNDLLRMEGEKDSGFFNVKYLKNDRSRSQFRYDKDSNRQGSTKYSESANESTYAKKIDLVWFYWDIIPSDLDVGRKSFPEKWLFCMANDNLIVYASPIDLDHNTIPVVVCSPDYDGYSPAPLSRLGKVSELQDVVNFMFNSHIKNLRKAVNDTWIADPSLISIPDLASPKAGKIIRLRRSAWGGNKIDKAIKQVPVNDVTRSNIADASAITNIMNNTSGATDFLQGSIPNRTSRISSNEVQGARLSGMSRLKRLTQLMSVQAMSPIGYLMASHTQQFMSEEIGFKVLGESISRYENINEGKYIKANPYDLVVDYDLITSDGSMPGSEDPQLWTQLYQVLAQNPELSGQFNMVSIFKHIAKQLGASNISDFEKPQVMPDEQVQEQAQRGNIKPMLQNGTQP